MKKIVIVDDMKLNIAMASKALEPDGYEITSYNSSVVCAEALNTVQADLFILDIEMPDINGFELTKKIRSTPRLARVPVIYFTGSSDPVVLEQAFANGGSDFLPKKISPLEMRLRVKNAINLHVANEKLRYQSKMMEVYLRLIFHDLASPLTVTMMNIERLKMTDHAAQGPILDKVSNAIGRISNLIADTKAFFQGASPAKYCTPSQITSDLQMMYEHRLHEKLIALKCEDRAGETTKIKIPKSFMTHQILANFISNAIKFSEKNSTLEVQYSAPRATPSGTFIDITIRDYGCGMPQHVVDAFTGDSASVSTDGSQGEKGTGSGVMIAKFFLEKFGSTLAISSWTEPTAENPRGTKITLSIPVVTN